jgi:hypothetical protein
LVARRRHPCNLDSNAPANVVFVNNGEFVNCDVSGLYYFVDVV